MIITKFNSYFDKHGKATYFVLCIIIAVIFVFTIGSGDSSCTGQERLTSIGSMYGSNLAVDDIMRKCSQIRLYYAMNNQRIPSRTNDYELIQMALEKMRLVHEAKEKGLDKITDDEFAQAICDLPYWRISDKDHSGNELDSTETVFTVKRFKGFMENIVKKQFKLGGEDFDTMMTDEILAQRVLDAAVKDIKADAAVVKTVAADSAVKVASFPFNLERDSMPAAADIDAFLKTREKELTDKDRMTNFFMIAVCDYDDLSKAAEKDPKLAAQLNPTDAEIKAFFDKNASALFKGKKLDEVKEQITKSVKATKAEAIAKKSEKALEAELAKPVPAKSTRYAQFRTAALKNNMKIVLQNGMPEGSYITRIHMQQKALVEAIKGIAKKDVPTAAVALAGDAGDNGFAIAMKVDNPNKEQNIRMAAADILRGEKALKLYDEKIAKVYEAKIQGLKTQDELVDAMMKGLPATSMEDPASYAKFVDVMNAVTNEVLMFVREADGKLVVDKPAVRDARLLGWYKRTMAAAAAEKRAAEALAGYQKALKDGKKLEAADTQKRFVDGKKPVSWYSAINTAMQMTYQRMYMSQGKMTPMEYKLAEYNGFSWAGSQMGVNVKNMPALVVELDKAADAALLAKPVEGDSAYLLVYQVRRALPDTEEGKKQVETAETMVLNQLKTKAINGLKAELLAKSETKLVDAIIPKGEN